MNANEILGRAVEILDSGNRWVKYNNAVDKDGKFCSIFSPSAVKWDIQGALLLAHFESGVRDFTEYHKAYEMARDNIPTSFRNRDIEDWNDFGDFDSAVSVLKGAGIPPVNPPEETVITVLGSELGFMFATEDNKTLIRI